MNIEVQLQSGFKSSKINYYKVQCGFFTGTVGISTGLFYKTSQTLTYLGGENIYWEYPSGKSINDYVTDYKPVDVKIIVLN